MLQIVYINRSLLLFTSFALGLWLVAFPLVAGVLTDKSAWFNYAVLGAVLIPVVALLLVLLRVLAWAFLYAFWAIQAFVGVLLMLGLAAFITMLISNREMSILPERSVHIPEIRLDTAMIIEPGRVPSSVFIVAVIALAISLAFFLALRNRSRDVSEHVQPAPAKPIAASSSKPLTYLDDRKNQGS